MSGFNLSAWALRHRALVLFLMLVSLIGGGAAFSQLGRMEDPHFDAPIMTVTVAWPGATAQEMQDQVLNRIERKLQQLDGIDYLASFARQGYGAVFLNMQGSLHGAELREAWYQARKRIGDIRQELPEGVQGPLFNDEFADVYSMLYALRADELSPAELREQAEGLRRRLQAVPGVNKVDLFGTQPEQLLVEFSSRRLAGLGLSPLQIADALRSRLQLTPAGSVDTRSDRVHVRVDSALHTADELRNLSIAVGGQLLRLGDVASVRPAWQDPAEFTVRRNGHPVIAIGLTMSPNGDILALGRALKALLPALRAGADVVIAGRVADPSLFLSPLVHRFGWSLDDWTALGRGTLAGHLMECGMQITGGYFADPGYKDVPRLADCGFPIAEVAADGSFVITKLDDTGGCVTPATVKEQLLYEVHDPRAYLTPDVVADFSGVSVAAVGVDRVRLNGADGRQRPDKLKVTIGFDGGFLGEGGVSYAGPNARARAELAAEVVRERLSRITRLGGDVRIDLIGLNALHQTAELPVSDANDIRLHVALRSVDRDDIDTMLWEVESLLCCGPAGGGGYRGQVTPCVVTRSCLIDRSQVAPSFEVFVA